MAGAVALTERRTSDLEQAEHADEPDPQSCKPSHATALSLVITDWW